MEGERGREVPGEGVELTFGGALVLALAAALFPPGMKGCALTFLKDVPALSSDLPLLPPGSPDPAVGTKGAAFKFGACNLLPPVGLNGCAWMLALSFF